ncbi:hypothetical protein ABFX02_01G112600 [Erythranthe guttata]
MKPNSEEEEIKNNHKTQLVVVPSKEEDQFEDEEVSDTSSDDDEKVEEEEEEEEESEEEEEESEEEKKLELEVPSESVRRKRQKQEFDAEFPNLTALFNKFRVSASACLTRLNDKELQDMEKQSKKLIMEENRLNIEMMDIIHQQLALVVSGSKEYTNVFP